MATRRCCGRRGRSERFVFGGEGLAGIDDDQGEVGVGHGLPGALDAQGLDQVAALADAGGVVEFDGDAADGSGLRDDVAGGAGDLGDDGAVVLEEAVEQAALADIGTADDGEGEAVADEAAVLKAGGETVDCRRGWGRGGAGSPPAARR